MTKRTVVFPVEYNDYVLIEIAASEWLHQHFAAQRPWSPALERRARRAVIPLVLVEHERWFATNTRPQRVWFMPIKWQVRYVFARATEAALFRLCCG